MIFIEIIQYGMGILMIILLSYQLILSVLALRVRKRIAFNSVQNRQFAIVMPAPKNEQMISKSLYSLFGLVYPKNLYDVFMVGDNLSNEAASIAREMGAIVLNKKNFHQDTNSHELQWTFEKILQEEKAYDAILIIESDSLVSGNYLDVMNYYLDNGSKIIQSSNLMLPQSGFQGKGGRQINFLLYNLVKPLGRKVFGFSMGLRGNGICFKTQILRNNLWMLDSITDDIGYGLKLQLKGIDIDFVHEAVLLTEIPTESTENDFQREERDIGWIPVVKHYAPELLKAGFRRKSLSYFKSFLDLIIPSSVDMLLIALVMAVINILMWVGAGWPLSFVWIWVFVFFIGVTHIAVGLYAINTYYQSYKSMH